MTNELKDAQGFLVACLCAQWCGSCRDYRPAFEAMGARFPAVSLAWVDVEDEPEVAGDIDIDNFPTLVIQRGADVLFCGPMLPHIAQLERLLQTFLAQTPAESHIHALSSPERAAWQGIADIRSRLMLLS
ncbi:MAG: thioredoxin-like protein [Rhodocyclales bacterium]|nr:thioredoxin-like protein [Rhodocyclales bacterium]